MSWFMHRSSGGPRTSRRASRPRTVVPHVEALEERWVPTVYNYGGSVLPHVEAQALFLGSSWSSTNAGQTGSLNSFLGDVTAGAYMDALTRAGYGVGRGSASAGAVDGTQYAANAVISDASIQGRIQADVGSGLLQAPDANRVYVVYVQPNVAVNLGSGQGTTQQGILGYHGAFSGHDASGNATLIHYAVIAYPGGTVNNSTLPQAASALDQQTAVSSHELAEAVTDPDVSLNRLTWYDPRRGEIGDIEEANPNAYVRLDGYLVQEVADRNDQLLAVAASQPPTTQPPQPTGSIATSSTLSASPVHYHWWSYPTVNLTVVISPNSGSVAPDGTVELLYGGTVLGKAKVQVVNGVAEAMFSVEFYYYGSYTFTTQYLGSGPFQASTSNAVTVTI
jgi:hypothetical protein